MFKSAIDNDPAAVMLEVAAVPGMPSQRQQGLPVENLPMAEPRIGHRFEGTATIKRCRVRLHRLFMAGSVCSGSKCSKR